ncbi:MAG: hypothetical protein ACKO1W_09020, partial [Microcystaceae cyanobacterium]
HWIARKVYQKSPAYRHFLSQQGINHLPPFQELPILEKFAYLQNHPFTDLYPDRFEHSLSLYASSGTSGKPQYWPMLRSSHRFSVPAMRFFLERIFQIHQQKTLIIVASSLGSWLGGEHFSWVYKSIAAQSSYPLTVFTPGSHPEEIIDIIAQFQDYFQQIIISIPATFISLLLLTAQGTHPALSLQKLKFIATSEYFPESTRLRIGQQGQHRPQDIYLVSMYGAVDANGLGVESPASIALRQLLGEYPDLATMLGIQTPLPLFFHSIAWDSYLEIINGKFCITRWQGIPLVRYHLPDDVAFYNWRILRKTMLTSDLIPVTHPLRLAIAASSSLLSNIIAIAGRADKGLVWGGNNFTEAMLDTAIKAEALQPILTGFYRAKVHHTETHAQLVFDLELQPNQIVEESLETWIRQHILETLIKLQPEFASDWRDIYQKLAPDYEMLKLNFLAWPALSELRQQTIKQNPFS